MSRHLTLAAIAAAVLGWLLAVTVGDVGWIVATMSLCKMIFLAALKLIIGPLIFLSLVSGVLSLENVKRFRTLGLTAIAYYLLTTGVAISIGLSVVYFIHPWTSGPTIDLPTAPPPGTLIDLKDASIGAVFVGLARSALVNPVAAFVDLNILGIVTNALLIGIASLFALPPDSRIPAAIHDLTQVVYRITGWIVHLVVLAITFDLAGHVTVSLLKQLLDFSLVVFGATLLHGLIVLPTITWVFAGVRPCRMFRAIV